MAEFRREVKVLGIDPGTTRLGYALLTGTSTKPRLLRSGVLGNSALGRGERLLFIYTELTSIIETTKPDRIVIEKLYFSKNVKTALAVAEARGVILLTAQRGNLKVYEYAPQEVKIALTSRGDADKSQVASMIQTILRLEKLPRWDDESDAMAIALTGLILAKGAA